MNTVFNSSFRLDTRFKRDIELSPEDILTILTLYEREREIPPVGYRTFWQRFMPTMDVDGDRDENDIEQEDESWLDTPVYPHAGHSNQFSPNFLYDDKPQVSFLILLHLMLQMYFTDIRKTSNM